MFGRSIMSLWWVNTVKNGPLWHLQRPARVFRRNWKMRWYTSAPTVIAWVLLLLFAVFVMVFGPLEGNVAFYDPHSLNSNNLLQRSSLTAKEYSDLYEHLGKLPPFSYDILLRNSLQLHPRKIKLPPRYIQILIASTWRSGTNFLNDLLMSHPGVFNHCEPLHYLGDISVYDETLNQTIEAQRFLHGVLKCKYTKPEYFADIKKSQFPITRNPNIYGICQLDEELCYDRTFHENACALFPINVAKSVRIGLKLLRPMLEDSSLNLHVVYLVRDPRAVMNSRMDKRIYFCTTDDCSKPSRLCEHMTSDLEAFKTLYSLYSNRIHLIRYEDLSLSPYRVTLKLMRSIGLDFHANMISFIKSHTSGKYLDPYSTSRNSRERVFLWLSQMKPRMLKQIQESCSGIMNQFGYYAISSMQGVKLEDILGPMEF